MTSPTTSNTRSTSSRWASRRSGCKEVWAKTEKVKGTYDFTWLDTIVEMPASGD